MQHKRCLGGFRKDTCSRVADFVLVQVQGCQRGVCLLIQETTDRTYVPQAHMFPSMGPTWFNTTHSGKNVTVMITCTTQYLESTCNVRPFIVPVIPICKNNLLHVPTRTTEMHMEWCSLLTSNLTKTPYVGILIVMCCVDAEYLAVSCQFA